MFKNQEMDVRQFQKQKDGEIDFSYSSFSNLPQFCQQFSSSTHNISQNYDSILSQKLDQHQFLSTKPKKFIRQVKQKLDQFHNQIRTHQRHLIKRQMRIEKFQKDLETLYWQKYLQQAMEQELQEERHWDQMAQQSHAQEQEFWECFRETTHTNQTQKNEQEQQCSPTDNHHFTITHEQTDVII